MSLLFAEDSPSFEFLLVSGRELMELILQKFHLHHAPRQLILVCSTFFQEHDLFVVTGDAQVKFCGLSFQIQLCAACLIVASLGFLKLCIGTVKLIC